MIPGWDTAGPDGIGPDGIKPGGGDEGATVGGGCDGMTLGGGCDGIGTGGSDEDINGGNCDGIKPDGRGADGISPNDGASDRGGADGMMPGASVDGATPKSVCRTLMWISCGVCVLGEGDRASSVDGVPSDTLFSAAYILCQLGKEIRRNVKRWNQTHTSLWKSSCSLGPCRTYA